MTIAQQLEQKGVEKGIEKGIQQGIPLGERRGKLELARALLQKGVDLNLIAETADLTPDELAQISR